MPAVSSRARVRLQAVAVALTVSSSLLLVVGSGPALAAGPAPVTLSTTGAITASAAALIARPTLSAGRTRATISKRAHVAKPVSKAGHTKAGHSKAGHTSSKAIKRAALSRKAAAKAHRQLAAERLARDQVSFGERVIREASRFNGTPYEYGAAGPSRFDCSGFTRYIFAKFGISLPHSSSGQYDSVQHVDASQKQVGDLVFFHTDSGHVYHVGIYAGDDEIWAATHTGDFVRLEGLWSASYYVGRVSA